MKEIIPPDNPGPAERVDRRATKADRDDVAKLPKEAIVVALIGLIIITGAAVAALAFNAIVHGGSTDGLTTIAAVGVGALGTTLGLKQNQ